VHLDRAAAEHLTLPQRVVGDQMAARDDDEGGGTGLGVDALQAVAFAWAQCLVGVGLKPRASLLGDREAELARAA
jgi:hypothetical protein